MILSKTTKGDIFDKNSIHAIFLKENKGVS